MIRNITGINRKSYNFSKRDWCSYYVLDYYSIYVFGDNSFGAYNSIIKTTSYINRSVWKMK